MNSGEIHRTRPRVGGLMDPVVTFARQARLALGVRGVALGASAIVFGLMCCVTSAAVIFLSLPANDVHQQRQVTADIAAIDGASRVLMRDLLATSAGYQRPVEGRSPLRSTWAAFQRSLEAICSRLDNSIPKIQRLRLICSDRQGLYQRVTPEIEHFNPPHRAFDPVALRELIGVRDDITEISASVTENADSLVERMTVDYRTSVLILAVNAAGFLGAVVVFVGLVGRASTHSFQQWQEACKARDLLQEIIDTVPAGIVLYDQQERLMAFNRAAIAATPLLRRPSVIGMTYSEIARETGKLCSAFAAPFVNTPDEWIERFRSKGASRMQQMTNGRWFEWSEALTPSGRTVGLRVDVTDLKTLQVEAQWARDQYQLLLDSLKDVVFKLDPRKGVVTFVSAAAENFFGVPVEQLVGASFLDYVVPEHHAMVRQAARDDLHSSRRVNQLTIRMKAASGELRHVETRVTKTIEDNGTPILSGVLRDVEERVQLERRLATETAHLRSIVESGGAMIVLTNRELKIVMVNSEFVAFTGTTQDAARSRPLTAFFECTLDPRVIEGWLSGRSTGAVRFTHKMVDQHGNQRIFVVTATPVVDAQGQVSDIVFLAIDDTERRQTEQALFDAERLATVGEMAGAVVHEISQPLQVIAVACASMEAELSEATAPDVWPGVDFLNSKVERIVGQIERAGRIVGELRGFVRGTASEEPASFDPANAIRGAIDLTAHALKLESIALTLSITEPLASVTGHVSRLEQVLVNLINNARDAGSKLIEVTAIPLERDGCSFVLIGVNDTGGGIPEDVLPRLFESFITTKPRGVGTGLGLRICRRIVEEMGGTIAAANRPEGGARFEVLLPAEAVTS